LNEILLVRDKQLLFAGRSGKMAFRHTCLDACFARTGACIGIVSSSHASSLRDNVKIGDLPGYQPTVKTQVIAKLLHKEKFQNLDRSRALGLKALGGLHTHTGGASADETVPSSLAMKGLLTRARCVLVESPSRSIFLFEHDLFGKPVSTFPDHALECVTVPERRAPWREQWRRRRLQPWAVVRFNACSRGVSA
jgi:hypothetical protein